MAGFWKKSLESNFIYLMRASACLTSGDMQYVDIRAITQSLTQSWCKVYVPTIMQYTETYSCDNKRTERGKKRKKNPVESSSSIFMFFGLFTTETSHTKVSGQLGNTILHLPKGFPSPFLFFSSRLRHKTFYHLPLCALIQQEQSLTTGRRL